MSIIFLVKKIFVKRRSEQYQKNFFLRIQCMYITCEKPCYQITSKDVPFRPRWAAHALTALRTRLDYQSVGLQLCVYRT